METDRPVDAKRMAIAAVLNSLGNAAIQQSQTASAIDEPTKMFLLSKEVEQELEFFAEEIKSRKDTDSFHVRRLKARLP